MLAFSPYYILIEPELRPGFMTTSPEGGGVWIGNRSYYLITDLADGNLITGLISEVVALNCGLLTQQYLIRVFLVLQAASVRTKAFATHKQQPVSTSHRLVQVLV